MAPVDEASDEYMEDCDFSDHEPYLSDADSDVSEPGCIAFPRCGCECIDDKRGVV